MARSVQEETFPSVPQAALLLLANFLLQYVTYLAILDLQGTLQLDKYQQSALTRLLANGVFLASIVHYSNDSYGKLVHPSKSSWIATAVLLGPAIVMLVPFLTIIALGLYAFLLRIWTISSWEENFFEMFRNASLATIIEVAVLAPIFEEMIFRGILLRAFLTRYPTWPAIAISALFFGFAHLNIYQFFLAFPMGLLLGWLYERSRSLIPSAILHASFNGAQIMFSQNSPEKSMEVQFTQISSIVCGYFQFQALPLAHGFYFAY